MQVLTGLQCAAEEAALVGGEDEVSKGLRKRPLPGD
jgi:hypothetical protein